MRILTVTHFFEAHGGGIERVAGHLCRQFARFNSVAVWAASGCDEAPGDEIQAVPLECMNPLEKLTGLPMPVPGIRSIGRLANQIRQSDAVVIHDALYVTSILALLIAKAYRKRVVLIQHIAGIPFSSRVLRLVMRIANRLVTRPMLWAADERVFISDTVRRDLLGPRPRYPTQLLFNGVDETIFHPAKSQTAETSAPSLLAGFGVTPGKRLVLFVGRFVEKKGMSVLRALAALRPDLNFLLVGSGPINPDKWALPNVHNLGTQTSQTLAELYRHADLLLLPSVGEGYPLVIQEAMACGLPVVCGEPSNRADPGAAEWICGVAIDLTDAPGSARRCADAIDGVALSRAKRAAMACYALQRYNWPAMARTILTLAGRLPEGSRDPQLAAPESIRPPVQTVSVGSFGLTRRHAATVLGGLIALKVALLFVLAWNTLFVMDEFAQLGWAKYFGNGLFDTLWPAKAVGYAVFYKLAHLIGWDAPSILLAARLQTAVLACGTLGLVYASARALGEDKVRALLIILILLCFSNFMERIFRTIAEPPAVFFAAAALLVVLRGHADKARTVIFAGIFSGLAFLATQKALYFNLALGIALVADAALARRYTAGAIRGAWLVLGWLAPVAAYCFIFGGAAPLPVAKSLVFGPVEVATQGAAAYGNLRYFVLQTLTRNAILYALCFAGMILALVRLRSLGERRRIALIFSIVVAALVFAHDQPWPYVFVMTLPFISLWWLWALDAAANNGRAAKVIWLAMGVAVAASFAKNIAYLQFDNREQLEVVTRAESLLGPDERYFDGVAMLPNRLEPTALWLDRSQVLSTLHERENSEAYRVFARTPPQMIIWSNRMDDIYPVVGPLIEQRYVRVAPNIRMLGRRLTLGKATIFDVPRAGPYALYSETGERLSSLAQVDGSVAGGPFELASGNREITLRSGPATALLLPVGSYAGVIGPGPDNDQLFAHVYD